jgi:hypothetical protein
MSFFIGSWALGNTSIWIPYRKVTKENYKLFMKS